MTFQDVIRRLGTLSEPSELSIEVSNKSLIGNHGEEGHFCYEYQIELENTPTHSIEFLYSHCAECGSVRRKRFVAFDKRSPHCYVKEIYSIKNNKSGSRI